MKDKTVLITGASSGIGLATAESFAREGAKLVLCARRIELLNKLSESFNKKYGIHLYTFQLDVQNFIDVKNKLSDLPGEFSDIDILVNNAGLAAGLDFIQDGDTDDWEKMIDTNIKGLLYVTKELLPKMIQKNSGHIINIGSIAGHQVYQKGAVYCATKYAVNAISQGLRIDLYGTKIRVTSIDPGAVATNFSKVRFKGNEERAAAVYHGMTPLSPIDVADAILYCAKLPSHVNVSEMIIMPTDQASATMVHRS
jgi:NADP-dependent 3-hydroxy acid dehydrogenase YdfG